MFCSSLRKRRDWRPALSMLSQRKAGEVAWKESNLDTHDIAFDVGQSSSAESTFRVILVSGNQEWASQKQRVERLKVLQGGRLLAVIFLINADEAATAFARVQCEFVDLNLNEVPLIPITSTAELLPCLNGLRKQMGKAKNKPQDRSLQDAALAARELVSNCADGARLSSRQTNILMDMVPSFRNLAIGSFQPHNRIQIEDSIGSEDGRRVISFFAEGPKPTLR